MSFSYFFATTQHKSRLMRVDLFRNWLLTEARASQTIDAIAMGSIRPALGMIAAE
ncbi:hypothetical protein LZK76_30660 (plasmid) [Rhizobium leguminosarum]|nr:hypothetical protein LZK76_30660 [Rhizobium leguminosarum]